MIHTKVRPEQLRVAASVERGRRRGPDRSAPSIAAARDEGLWETAPVLAGVVLFSTLMCGWVLRNVFPMPLVGGWAIVVLAAAGLYFRTRRRALGRGVARPDSWRMPIALGLLAMIWSLLPALAYAPVPPDGRVLIGGMFFLMMACGALFTVTPIAAVLWSVPLGVSLVLAILLRDGAAGALSATLVVAFLATLLVGIAHAARLLRCRLGAAAEIEARADRINSLLTEYEEQGAGWLWQIDSHNRLTYVSPRLSSLLGRPTMQVMGQSLPVLLGGDARLGGALVERVSFAAIEFKLMTAQGERWISLSGNPVFSPAERMFEGFRGVGSDVTEWRHSQQRLTHMASSDVLTGLPNRQRVRELLDVALVGARTSGTPCAVLFLDLDGFKPVNDTFGHAMGDAVLRSVARRLVQETGGQGTVGRMGGDEFAIVLREAGNRESVAALSGRIIDRVAEPYQIDGTQVRIGISIGGAVGPIDAGTVDELVQKADLALYIAKAEGRGTFRHFDPKMQSEADERQRIEADLRLALERRQFRLQFQPVIGAESRGVISFEALLRWDHPELGSVSPQVFIPIAEETGLIGDIGEWVVLAACRAASHWPDHISVAINVSPRQLVLPALPNAVSRALGMTGIKPHRLEIEVTENVFLDGDNSLDVLRRLRQLGVGITLDDFGSGYSSLGYLNKTIFHKLKIDGSFVRDAGRRPDSVAIIRAIVDIANSFRMTIVAEGVETVADFNRMRELGCHQVQGYLFGKPVGYEKTLEMVGEGVDGARAAG